MDPLTHTAAGLFLSRAGLKRWTPQAAPILMLAANAPDIDILAASRGWLNYIQYHRHLTHSLLAMPVMAILPVLLVRGVSRKPVRWIGAFGAALLAVASHLLLDYTNVYGIRLLWPFSSQWLRLDLTGVVDLWIWAALLLCFIGPWLSHLVGSEISSSRARPRNYGRGFAILALLFLLFYNGGRAVLHARAVATLDSRLYRGETPSRVVAIPGLNPLVWRGLVETREFYDMADVDLTGTFDPTRGMIFYKPAPDPALQSARQTAVFQQFLTFVQFPLWQVTAAPEFDNRKRVDLFDMRFGTPSQPGFHTSALLDAHDQVLKTSFDFGGPPPR
jgi:inner membrane protein